MNTSGDLTVVQKKPTSLSWWQNILLDWEKTQLTLTFLLMLLAALSPLVVKSPYYLGIIILTVIYAYVGISWNIVAGFTGLLLIGHVIFFGVGAFTTIMLLNHLNVSPWIGIPIAGITAAILGVIVAYLTSRYGLKLDYFALFTIALIVALAIIFSQFEATGGAEGIWISYEGESFWKMSFVSKVPYLYIGLGLLLLGVIVQYKLYRSKWGKYFLAIREDEAAAAALGVNITLYKMLSTVLAAALAGMGGGFWVMYTTFVDPFQVFNLGFNVEICLVAPIIGGLGTLIGPIVGAILNKPAVEIIRGTFAAQRGGTSLIIYGLFLIVFILFLPQGVAGLLHTPYEKLRRRVLKTSERKE
jgi:branched-chain amino acid transport system permease protein